MITEKLAYLETVMSVLMMRDVCRETGCDKATALIALGREMEAWGGNEEPLSIESIDGLMDKACVAVREAQDAVTEQRMDALVCCRPKPDNIDVGVCTWPDTACYVEGPGTAPAEASGGSG